MAAQPLVIAYHLIWTTYGAWFPNDPRGSSSEFVASPRLFELNDLHRGRKKVQPARAELLAFKAEAQSRLKFPVLELRRAEVAIVAGTFREAIADHKYTCYACAIMPDHVHILIRKHRDLAEEMIDVLQNVSRLRLRTESLRTPDHPVWGGPGWKVFLDCPDDIRRTIRYIENNPVKMRAPIQRWDFVKPYDGWPLHPGHSPNSPYARRLRNQ